VRRGGGSYIGSALQLAIGRKPSILTAPERVYLDHAATTPVLPEARAAMTEALQHWANPSSPHADGRAARAALEEARAAITEALGWRHDVILTSGASEAISVAARRARVPGRSRGPTEHDAVVATMGPTAVQILVDENGLIDLDVLDSELAEGPALVAIQHVNNETGVVQRLESISAKVREAGSLLLADCAQSAGKMPLPDADFIAVSAHKLGGPPGMGALLVRDIAKLEPSGGQEKGYRRGTENVPAAAGFAAALGSRAFAEAMPRLAELRARLEEAIVAAGGVVIAAASERIPTIGAYAMPGVTSASQLVQFDLAGIAISAGSACSSGSMKPSRVLEAMRVPADVAGSVIRVSFGPSTASDDVDRFLADWRRVANQAGIRAA
jgi:cysteine desulfurase